MKKPLKITLITLGSLIGLTLITIVVACWIVVTPARLTSIVKNQAPNFINCDFDIERADITVFKSFPKVGLKINDVVLVNPMEGSPSDTLAYINECVVSVDIKKFLKENQIIIDECRLNGGYVNLFIDSRGNTNADIFLPSEPDTVIVENESEFSYGIDLNSLRFNDISINYTDLMQDMFARLDGMNMSAKGRMEEKNIAGNVIVSLRDIAYQQTTDTLSMTVRLNNLKLEGDAEMNGDDITADIKASSSFLSYENAGQSAELNSLNFKYKGDVDDYDIVKGNVEMAIDDLSFIMDEELLVDKADLRMIAPLDVSLSNMDIELGNSQLALNNIMIDLVGKASMHDDVVVDLNLKTNTLIMEDLIGLIPASMREEMLDGIDVKGELQLAANIKGVYNETSIPVVNAELEYNKGMVSLPEMLPYPITNLNTSIKANLDLNDQTDIYVNHLNAKMSNSSLKLSGSIKDILNKMYCNINLNAAADLNELQTFIPENIEAKGDVKVNVIAKVNKYQLDNMDFSKANVDGNLQWNDMNVVYYDTVNVNADRLDVIFTLPNSVSEEISNSLMAVKIAGTNLDAKVSDMIMASLGEYNITAQVSDILDERTPMSIYADYNFSRIDATTDSITFFANNPKGSVAMFMKENNKDALYVAVYNGDSLSFEMGEFVSFATETLDLNVSADYDNEQDNLLLQWNPHAGIQLDKAVFTMNSLPMPIYIPSIDFQYDTSGIKIENSSVVLGNSDFELKGKLTNVDEFIRKEKLLKGTFDFTSQYTDVNQLMNLFSGMGDTVTVEEEIVMTDTISEEGDPFMVPLGIDVTLNTKIKKAIAGNMNISDVGGNLIVKNGVMVLQEMGFTSDAAIMELTAMYKSSRKNHLFLGFDLHLLDINIDEMINLIPELDTIVPMLSSFAGNAEFHIAAQTYLKSNYELKMSTLKGSTAIHGKDLVILDNKTYKKIGRMLGFKDKEHNKIDSFNAEITVFKNEVDVFPTLITVDKYQAVVGGRHKLDMTFDYKLGISNPWLFRRLGIIIRGNSDDIKFGFKGKRNIGLENPKGKKDDVHTVEESLRLKDLIYQTLK